MLNTTACADDLVDDLCNTFFAYGDHLRCAAMSALEPFFPNGDCTIRSYLSMNAGDDAVSDSLIVVLGPLTTTANSGPIGPTIYQAQFDVILRESGYPMVKAVDGGRAIAKPDPDEQNRATRQLMQHAGAILTALNGLKTSGCLQPPGYVRCSRSLVSGMQPMPASGGVAGWIISVTIWLPWG
jgi:hypothetical protein